MIEFWNDRYEKAAYAYGKEPNVFFKSIIDSIDNKGTALFPAEGEGRNAVYAAKLGWDSYAFDTSEKGKEKALQLAQKQNVIINYSIDSFESYNSNVQFDLIVLCYTHVPSQVRSKYFKKCIELLKPNGKIVLEGFSKKQLGLNSGGPKKLEMLFSEDELRIDFSSTQIIELTECEVDLNEGDFHKGKAQIIRLITDKI